MSRNGAGTYSLYPGVNPVVTGTTISSSWANNTLNDIATALTASIANDGQTPIVANLPMSTYRHTGVGNAVARTDYAAAGQVQDSAFLWGGTAGGTADALTITLSPAVTAWATGQRFLFISGASPNATTTPTLSPNGITAKTFKRKDGTTIAAGDIPASTLCEAVYDGTNVLLVSQGAALLTKLGTVTTGTWNASVIGPAYGGTGVANNAASTITISGAYASTFTLTNTTSVTFPTSGTLLSTAAAVTPAQGGTGLTTLTANNVILGNGTSNVQFVAPGSSGNVLTSNGTTWQSSTPASSALVYLSTTTASNSAVVDIETTFDGTYDEYILEITALVPASDATLQCRMKIGGSYLSTSTYYYAVSQTSSADAANAYSSLVGTAQAQIVIATGVGSSSGKTANYTFRIHNPASTTRTKLIDWSGGAVLASLSDINNNSGSAGNSGTSALTGLRFFMNSGNISSGTFRLYGIKTS